MSKDIHASRVSAGSLRRSIGATTFFKDVDDSIFMQAEQFASEVHCDANSMIMQRGESSPYAWFLVEGAVKLSAPGQITRTISAADADTQYPIANLRPCRYDVTADLQCRLIRLEQSFLKRLTTDSAPARFSTAELQGGGSWQSHPFAVEVVRMQQADEFEVPAMPGISARISQAMTDPEFEVADMAKLIGADPAIAGRLMSIANSALFKRHEPCQTLQTAIVRLGLQQTRTLVTTLAAKNLFAGRQSWIKQPLQTCWRHAVDIAAYAAVLSGLTPGLDRAQLLLLGLLHELGAIPILEVADRYPTLKEAPGVIDAVLANLAPALTVATLESWGLKDFAESVFHQEDWPYEHEGKTNATDVLIVAHVHDRIKSKRTENLPRLDEIPAFRELAEVGLTASVGVSVLEEAKQELAELRTLLT